MNRYIFLQNAAFQGCGARTFIDVYAGVPTEIDDNPVITNGRPFAVATTFRNERCGGFDGPLHLYRVSAYQIKPSRNRTGSLFSGYPPRL